MCAIDTNPIQGHYQRASLSIVLAQSPASPIGTQAHSSPAWPLAIESGNPTDQQEGIWRVRENLVDQPQTS